MSGRVATTSCSGSTRLGRPQGSRAGSCCGSSPRRWRSSATTASRRVEVVRNELVEEDGRIVARPIGETGDDPAGLVLRSVGYKGVALPGRPFDERSGTIPNDDGRVDGRRAHVRGRLDQARPERCDRHEQEGCDGDRRAPARDAGRRRRGDAGGSSAGRRSSAASSSSIRLAGGDEANERAAAGGRSSSGSGPRRWEGRLTCSRQARESIAASARSRRTSDRAPTPGEVEARRGATRRPRAPSALGAHVIGRRRELTSRGRDRHGFRFRALGRRDPQGGRQLPGLRRADPGARGALARPDQGRGGARERRARAARRRQGASGSPRPADRVAAGELDDQFPIDVFQTGSGTSSNMNANEVIATLAGEDVHPNDDVNMGQTSNDVFPSAVHLAALDELVHDLLPALDQLGAALRAKATEFDDVVKSGRTHWMDAVPGDARPGVRRLRGAGPRGPRAVESTLERLGKIPLGGTAVGTGLNTHPEFAARVRARLAARHRPDDLRAGRSVRGQATRDGLVEASGALKTVAVWLTKIANDLRLLGSGPRAGLAEIFLPELQKGSSIMPGKVNPVIPEVVTQVAAQVIGNDTAIAVGGMQGHFELNVFIPLMARNLLAVDRAPGLGLPPARREVRRRHRGEPRAVRELRRADALGGDGAQPVHRLRQGRARSSRRPPRRAGRCARSRARTASRTTCSTRRSTTAGWPSRTASRWSAGPVACFSRLFSRDFSGLDSLSGSTFLRVQPPVALAGNAFILDRASRPGRAILERGAQVRGSGTRGLRLAICLALFCATHCNCGGLGVLALDSVGSAEHDEPGDHGRSEELPARVGHSGREERAGLLRLPAVHAAERPVLRPGSDPRRVRHPVAALLDQDGTGRTIAIVDAYGSSTIDADLASSTHLGFTGGGSHHRLPVGSPHRSGQRGRLVRGRRRSTSSGRTPSPRARRSSWSSRSRTTTPTSSRRRSGSERRQRRRALAELR